MTPAERAALRTLAEALPAEAAMLVPRAWVLALLAGETADSAAAAPAGADLTVHDLAQHFGRKASTVRQWIERGEFAGAYRFRGREWRVPPASLRAFEAAQREQETNTPRRRLSVARPGERVNLSDWRQAS